MELFDCTLRDGANVVGKGFSAKLTRMMIEGLLKNNIKKIEFGNCLGLGAYDANNAIAPLTDAEYCDLVQPYLGKGEIGMFMGVKNANEHFVSYGASRGLKFLRIGANAGDGKTAINGIKLVKKYGMKCRYSMMKGYILSATDLANEARMLEDAGLDAITIMDSAGTMRPDMVGEYVAAMTKKVSIPVGFHGHNNLGLSVANAMTAFEAGASEADCGLMGMARSAGNCATELIAAAMQQQSRLEYVNLLGLLHFIHDELEPAMEQEKSGFKPPVEPLDLVYGYAGCHSSFAKLFIDIAEEQKVDLYQLIIEVSKINRKNPSEALIYEVSKQLKR